LQYTTLEGLRKYGSFDSNADDPLLSALISSASRTIDLFTGRTFAVEEATDRIFTRPARAYVGMTDPFEGPVLLLDEELADAPSAITGSPSVTYLPQKAPFWAIVLDSGSWSPPITVTGFWGYSMVAPPDIEFVCLRLAKWLYSLRETTRGDAVVVTDQGAVLLPSSLPADVIALLAPYRGPRASRQ